MFASPTPQPAGSSIRAARPRAGKDYGLLQPLFALRHYAGVPRFFFHLHNDLFVPDEEGTEFPDLAAAREHAIEGARSLMAEALLEGRLRLQHRIEVADEHGRVLMSIKFRELVNIEGLSD